mgnify:CR=1 FL=1
MNEKRIYKRYPPSFKEEAVALVTEQGYSVAEATMFSMAVAGLIGLLVTKEKMY